MSTAVEDLPCEAQDGEHCPVASSDDAEPIRLALVEAKANGKASLRTRAKRMPTREIEG